MIRIAEQGDWPLVGKVNASALGAPFIGNQNDFPINNRTYWLAGYVARLFGLLPAVNIMMLAFHLLAAFSFYIAARLWRVSRLPAWSFSVVYAMLPQFSISLAYFGVLSFGLLPLQLYTCWYIATVQNITWQSSRFRLALAVGLLSGFLNIYWVFIFVQFYTFALLRRLLCRQPDFLKSVVPLGICLLAVSLFLSSHVVYNIENGKNIVSVIRSYHYVEYFSMKPV